MPDVLQQSIRKDCLASLAGLEELPRRLLGHRIAVIGGTGFVGAWLAEMVAALNDDFGCQVRLDLLGRSADIWPSRHPHLVRADITTRTIDTRAAFELAKDTTLVVFAAGVADPRVQASDPHRVFETCLGGIGQSLAVAARLELIQRFVNLSSGLVLGGGLPERLLAETDIGTLDFTRPHNVYAESRRAAESLATIYAAQYRIPVSTARAFTFLGPYQALDAPWAVNNFMRDALAGNDIRIHGDGATRRAYLYGSDVAAWLLKMLLDGVDGGIYNVGGGQSISHAEIAQLVADLTHSKSQLVYKSQPGSIARSHDFVPDLRHTLQALGLRQTFGYQEALERSMQWHAQRLGVSRLIRPAP